MAIYDQSLETLVFLGEKFIKIWPEKQIFWGMVLDKTQ